MMSRRGRGDQATTPTLLGKRLFAVLVVGIVAVGCGRAAARNASVPSPALARWTPYVRLASPIDVAGRRRDGAIVVAADGRLWLL